MSAPRVARIGSDLFQMDTVNGSLFIVGRHPSTFQPSLMLGDSDFVLDLPRLHALIDIHERIFSGAPTPPDQITDPVFPVNTETTDEKA